MDILKNVLRVQKFSGFMLMALVILNIVGMAWSGGGTADTNNIYTAMRWLCNTARSMLGAVAMVLVVMAGVTYAIGQVLGAETRARAAVWATAMLTGAVIGLVIYIVMPYVIGALFTGTAGGGGNPCDDVAAS